MLKDEKGQAIVLLVVCVFFWGSVFPLAKVALAGLSPLALAVWRFLIAVLCLGFYQWRWGQAWPSLRLGHYVVVAIAGIVGIGGFNLGLFSGLEHTSAANAALIMALSPLVTSLLAAALARRPLSGLQWLSLVCCLAGVSLVLTQGHFRQLHLSRGDGDMLLAMLAWCFYTLSCQWLGKVVGPVQLTLATMISGCLALLLAALAQGDSLSLFSLGPKVLLVVLYIGLFATVASYLLWVRGVQQLGAERASLFFNLVPVFAALVALLLGQPLTLVQLAGMAVVLAGLTLPRWWPALGLPVRS
ncbi:DMT family transporter [Gallaecimonas kandeliae]|uniref:DMT family transporter n=1 Tax=Gallaecimonas kandeliae TaxID=3029055 RepID=UPI0026472C90|nr:DMT family transporter [Gallaecimonas kandeliae]WKE65108.1 DMT family transporter [Gallaecimonas kandeliae]